jgi:hypothetical protein
VVAGRGLTHTCSWVTRRDVLRLAGGVDVAVGDHDADASRTVAYFVYSHSALFEGGLSASSGPVSESPV